ncbi:MAG: ACT domain-containing protein [Acidobacteriota bacterium]
MDRERLAYGVAEILLRHLPQSSEPSAVEAITADLVRLLEAKGSEAAASDELPGRRLVVLTVLGRNHSGIVHAFSEVLAEAAVDIVDINQTIVHGNFAMMMIVDPTSAKLSFSDLKAALKRRGDEVGVQVFVQYEDLMRALNRI